MTEPEPDPVPQPEPDSEPAPEPEPSPESLPSLDQPVLDLGREAIRQTLMAAVADIAQLRADLTALQDTVAALTQAAPPTI